MTIAVVSGSEGGGTTDSSTSTSFAFGGTSFAAGALIVFHVAKFDAAGNDPFVAGDCTKTAGTCTINTPTMDVSKSESIVAGTGGTPESHDAIYSCLVTGAGTLTLTVAGAAAGSFWVHGGGGYSGSWDSTRVEHAPAVASTQTDGTTRYDSNTGTSAGAALLIGGMSTDASSNITGFTQDSPWVVIFTEMTALSHKTGSTGRQIVSSGTSDIFGGAIGVEQVGWISGVVVYKEAAASGPPQNRMFYPRQVFFDV